MAKKLKVAIIYGSLLHYRLPLFNYLADRYELTVFTTSFKENKEECLFKVNEIIPRQLGPLKYQVGLSREVSKGEFDLLIIFFDVSHINCVLFTFLINHSRKILWGPWMTESKIANLLRIQAIKRCEATIFYCYQHLKDFLELGVNQDQLYVAPNTVMVPVIEKSKITKDVILFVGSFTKRKGLDRLVRLFNNIKDRIDSDINLMLIGDGQEKENIEHLIEELKLENRIKLVGRINNSESLIPYFKRAILSISLSQAGLSVLQSMGFGVPFFTLEGSISGGETSNIDHNINGFIVKDNDLLIEEELIKILNDRKRTEACGNSAKEHYLRYASIKNYAQGFIDAIEKESKTNVYVVEK